MDTSVHTGLIPVMEEFYTLQGEGAFSGSAAWFIRLAGCDVGCVWCDVKESWDASAYPSASPDIIAARAQSSGAPIAVVTGGEPAMYPLGPLTQSLRAAGMRTHIETSGAYNVSGNWHWICFSPKKFKKPVGEIYSIAHELKVVVYHKSDLEWAEQHASKVSKDCLLYLQPEWSKSDAMLPIIIEYVKQNPKWRVSLQTHKYMQIP